MASLKMSNLIVGMILISLVGVLIALFYTGLVEEYDSSLNSSIFDEYDVYSNQSLEATTKNIDANSTNLKADPSAFDKLTSWVGSAFKVFTITKESTTTFNDLTDQAIEDANIGKTGTYLKTFLVAIVILLIGLLFIQALLKWWI